jgi:hypothetical protein
VIWLTLYRILYKQSIIFELVGYSKPARVTPSVDLPRKKVKTQNWQYKKSKNFSSVLGAKSYEGDAKNYPTHQVIYGAKKNRVFFRTYACRGNHEELSKVIDKPDQTIAMRGRKRAINLVLTL